ncbi:MAG: LysM peptidoglycan-binding domain-containing protein [Proteobacteria bacterium]|nr:LysM peptidoglycan-binding domain-containing protein [Pseudomonadota bacterium]
MPYSIGHTANAVRATGRCAALLLFFSALMAPAIAQNASDFPRPESLEPAVQFWIRVYTEVDTQSGFLHDAEHLDVIYTSLPLDRKQIEAKREAIKAALAILSTGKRTGLTAEEQQVLALWPSNVSNQTLKIASDNVRWQLGQSNRFLAGLRRSGAYREHIQKVIAAKNLPPQLVVLPHVESSFNPGAYSSADAAGMWQFTRATGQRFMRIDHIVDERMDPYIAAEAAMSLLEYNYRVLGTWPLALTAYNHGAGGIARAVREMGSSNIEDIVANYKGRRFGFASRNFYAQFLAVNEVEKRAESFFGKVDYNPAPNFTEFATDAYIDAEVFARSANISLAQLKADNPALRPVVWEGHKRIPRGFKMKLRDAKVTPQELLASIDGDYKFVVQTPDVAYTVVRGDSLSAIAKRFNTSVSRLVALNQLTSSHRIQIGQQILLPQDETSLAAQSQKAPADGIYTVARGDTVSMIARRFSVGETALLRLNGIEDSHRIYPGQELRLPGLYATQPQLVATERTPASLVDPVDIAAVESEAERGAVSAESIVAESLWTPSEIERNASDAAAEQGSDADAPQASEAIAGELALVDAVAVDIDAVAEEVATATSDNTPVESDAELAEALSADPADYSVASDDSIEVQATETLGHYADWLAVRAWDVRRLNGMAYSDPVIVGKRLTLSFTKVSRPEFERRRKDYHSTLQREFFAQYRIRDVEEYTIRRNENIGTIARNRYSAPLWLVRQYNPELDFNRIQIGQKVVFPLLQSVE